VRTGDAQDPHEPSDEALMAQLVAGDPRAFRRLFERYGQRIYLYSRRRLPSDQDAEDVTQQTFLRMYRARDSFRPGSRLGAWLFTICLNTVREFHRRARSRPEWLTDTLDEREAAALPPPQHSAEARGRELAGMLEQLPPALREVVLSRGIAGRDYGEIARDSGVPVPTLRVRWHRALRRLEAMAAAREAS
jgi:RNA polymerase sigma-70 factor (ECF subfamily)